MSKHEVLAGICIDLTYISTPITSDICSETKTSVLVFDETLIHKDICAVFVRTIMDFANWHSS